jgi:hypothetical protein
LVRPDLEIHVLRDHAELAALAGGRADRLRFEQHIAERHRDEEHWLVDGFCQACDQPSSMRVGWEGSYEGRVNFREQLTCERCGLNNRRRFAATMLREAATPESTIAIYEAAEPLGEWAPASLPGEAIALDGDASAIGEGQFDVIVSQDGLADAGDPDDLLAAYARGLRESGWLYLWAPIAADPGADEAAAGWDLLERCRSTGFAEAHVLAYWSVMYGYLGDGLQLMVAARTP